jgi:hypothetical protein
VPFVQDCLEFPINIVPNRCFVFVDDECVSVELVLVNGGKDSPFLLFSGLGEGLLHGDHIVPFEFVVAHGAEGFDLIGDHDEVAIDCVVPPFG